VTVEHRPSEGITLAHFPLHRSARRSARSSFLSKQHDFLGVAVRESFMHSCFASAMLQDQQNKVCFETDRRFERLKKRPVLCQTSHPCAGSSRQRRPTYVQLVTIYPAKTEEQVERQHETESASELAIEAAGRRRGRNTVILSRRKHAWFASERSTTAFVGVCRFWSTRSETSHVHTARDRMRSDAACAESSEPRPLGRKNVSWSSLNGSGTICLLPTILSARLQR
jgi:hypothetical protein